MTRLKEDKIQMNLSVKGLLKEHVETMVEETLFSKADIGRMALSDFFEGRQNEPVVMLNLIMMQQVINDMEATIQDDQKDFYKQLKQSMANIMVIKGGR